MKRRIDSIHKASRVLLSSIVGFSLAMMANQLFADIFEDIGVISLEDLLNIEISVASGKKALTTRESPGIVSVITAREIRNSGARDLVDILRLVPGIEFGVDVWGITGISMRGNWAHEGKVLLMMDGQELNELAFSTNMLGSHYSVDQIQAIEIIRGPGSAIYGGFAELGVINIITKSGKDLSGFAGGINYGQLDNASARQQVHLSLGKETDTMEGSVLVFFSDGRRSDRDYTDIAG